MLVSYVRMQSGMWCCATNGTPTTANLDHGAYSSRAMDKLHIKCDNLELELETMRSVATRLAQRKRERERERMERKDTMCVCVCVSSSSSEFLRIFGGVMAVA